MGCDSEYERLLGPKPYPQHSILVMLSCSDTVSCVQTRFAAVTAVRNFALVSLQQKLVASSAAFQLDTVTLVLGAYAISWQSCL